MPPSALCRAARHLLPILLGGGVAWAQAPAELPFAPGERLTYAARFHAGVGGGGTLSVEPATSELDGRTVWVLRSDMEGHVGPIRASERNGSWLDPERMTALRYTSSFRHLFKRRDDVVSISPAEGRWRSKRGLEGELATDRPLDELSFLYYLRTLPLQPSATIDLSRHFDAARNPTTIRVLAREEVEVGAGRFRAVIVEMRVRDSRRYQGEGTIRIALSDDGCRLPLRLESRVPDAGAVTLLLASYEGMRGDCTARVAH